MPTIERVAAPDMALHDRIMDVLIEHNERAAGPAKYAQLALAIRENDQVTGGLWAEFYYDWCFVRLLVVPETARGQGLGTRLMNEAEAFTRAQGGDGVWLDTFTFQARGFYEKLGYTVFGEIPGHPRPGARFFLHKRLSCQEQLRD